MRRFGELEAVIMERLWGWGRPVLVREVVDALHDDRAPAYTTVMTVMENLYRKGVAGRQPTVILTTGAVQALDPPPALSARPAAVTATEATAGLSTVPGVPAPGTVDK